MIYTWKETVEDYTEGFQEVLKYIGHSSKMLHIHCICFYVVFNSDTQTHTGKGTCIKVSTKK